MNSNSRDSVLLMEKTLVNSARSMVRIGSLTMLAVMLGCGDDVAVGPAARFSSDVAESRSMLAVADSSAVPSESDQPAESPRKLVRNATLSMYVSDVEKALRRMDTLAAQSGSMILRSESSSREDRRSVEVTFRTPAAKLDATLSALRGFGKVSSEALSTDDISKAYADLETRLAVKEQSLNRLRALLDTKAAKLSDVLDLEREIARTLSEVEQMKGERRYYDNQVAMSLVMVTFSDSEFASSRSFSTLVRKAFVEARGTLGVSVAAIVYLVVFLLPWALIGYPLWRYFRNRRRGAK